MISFRVQHNYMSTGRNNTKIRTHMYAPRKIKHESKDTQNK